VNVIAMAARIPRMIRNHFVDLLIGI